MKKHSLVVLAFAMLVALSLSVACSSSTGVVTVNSDALGTGIATTGSGLKIVVADWGGGVITVSDIIEDDAIQIALPGDRTMVGEGFFWVPGGTTTTETVLTFPISGTYDDGVELALFWFDVENQIWISFAGINGVVDGNTVVVTLPNGATGLGGNFAIAD
ncbi:hypothetical protein J7K50_03305 [bacterium]|nr:hypothetical protein [bacterium]